MEDAPDTTPSIPAPSPGSPADLAEGLGGVVVKTLEDVLGNADLNAQLAAFIGGILTPIIKQEVDDAFNRFFAKTGEVGKPIDALQHDFDREP